MWHVYLCVSLKYMQYKMIKTHKEAWPREKKSTEVDLQMTQMWEMAAMVFKITILSTETQHALAERKS